MADTELLLKKLEEWWNDDVYASHIENIEKLRNPKNFNINPFLHPYIANFVYGDISPLSLATSLVLPRAMGTSLSTTFGRKMQKFIVSNISHANGSGIGGIDIEFEDQTSGNKQIMYCQLKAGPNTINSGDVSKIVEKFTELRRKARLDHLDVGADAAIVGILYGNRNELSGSYKSIENKHQYGVYIGKEFWLKLTGDIEFYEKMILKLAELSNQFDERTRIESIIDDLARTKEIIALSKLSHK